MKHPHALFTTIRAAAILAIGAGLAALTAGATTWTWDGGGANENWATTANWNPNGTPLSGDTLVFADAWGKTTNNLAADTAFTVRLTCGGNDIYGNRVKLNGLYTYNTEPPPVHGGTNFINLDLILNANVLHENTANECLLNGDVNLNTHTLTLSNYNNCNSYYSGQITNTGNIVKRGTEDVYFIGPAANTYTGTTTVREGALHLGKKYVNGKGITVGNTSIPGALIIGDNTGTNSYTTASGAYDGGGATVILDFGNQFDAITATIYRDGWLDLNGYNDTIGSLVLSNGAASTLTGTLTLSSNLTVAAGSTNAFIAGELAWSSATNHTLDIATNLVFQLAAVVSGSGDWAKTGGGKLLLSGTNTFSGDLAIETGEVRIGNPFALGSTNGITIVKGDNHLNLPNAIAAVGEPLLLYDGSYFESGDTNTWAGPITLTNTLGGYCQMAALSGRPLTLSGPINGNGNIFFFGTVQLSGAAANTYTGYTFLTDTTVLLNKTAGTTAIPGNLFIGGGISSYSGSGTVKLMQSNQITNSSIVSIYPTSLLDLNGQNATIGGLEMKSGRVQTGSGTLTLAGPVNINDSVHESGATNSATIEGKIALGSNVRLISVNGILGSYNDLVLNANLISGGWIKGGPGTLWLNGTNTHTGATYITNGVVRVVGNPYAFGSTGGETYVGVTATLFLSNVTITNEPLFLDSVGGATYPGLVGDSAQWLGYVSLTGPGTMDGTINGDLTIGGQISGNPGVGFTKTGNNTVIIANAQDNTFDGPVAVNQGALKLANPPGVVGISSDITVASGAYLEGSGRIFGQINGGRVAPGNITDGALGGRLVAGTASFSGGQFYADYGTTNQSNDCLTVSNLTLASCSLFLRDAKAGALTPGHSYIIVSNLGPAAVSGTFAGNPEGTLSTNAGQVVAISYTGGNGNDITLTRVGFGAAGATNCRVQPLGNGVFRFNATGSPGYLYRLITTTNANTVIANWTSLGDFIAGPGGALQINRTNAPGEPRRFYRLRSL